MGRPAKSLLERCQERSFRARHHSTLLISEPDLPRAELCELQQRARAAETEQELRTAGRLFERTLASLPPEELHLRVATESPCAADDAGEQEPATPASDRRLRHEQLLAAVEAALADLPTHFGTELTALEAIEVELIRRAAERLAEVDQRLAEEGATVPGSQRQPRPHPLLSADASLRRELTQRLRQLEFRVRSRAQVERLNALSRHDQLPRAAPRRPRQRRARERRLAPPKPAQPALLTNS